MSLNILSDGYCMTVCWSCPPYTHKHTHIQELVSLLLTGVAVSNVFDGEMNLGSKGKEEVRE